MEILKCSMVATLRRHANAFTSLLAFDYVFEYFEEHSKHKIRIDYLLFNVNNWK